MPRIEGREVEDGKKRETEGRGEKKDGNHTLLFSASSLVTQNRTGCEMGVYFWTILREEEKVRTTATANDSTNRREGRKEGRKEQQHSVQSFLFL